MDSGAQRTDRDVERELTELMDKLVPAAKDLLQRFDEFYPFGGVINVIGEFELINAKPDESEHPNPTALVKFLSDALATGMSDGRFRAIGVCLNTTTTDPKTGQRIDAIQVTIKHTRSMEIHFFVPYSKENGNYVLRQSFFLT